MTITPENKLRIRREIDLDDPQTLIYFGVSPQRRLGRLAKSIAAQDSTTAIQETADALSDAVAFISHKPTRWLDPFLRMIAIIPVKTPEQRYAVIGTRLGNALTKLQHQRATFDEWRQTLNEITADLELHLAAGYQAISEREGHSKIHRLKLRLDDLKTSLSVTVLVSDSLAQRQYNYALLIEQLNAILGSGASAWHIHRAQMRSAGKAGLQKLRDLAEACQTADKTWKDSAPDPSTMTD